MVDLNQSCSKCPCRDRRENEERVVIILIFSQVVPSGPWLERDWEKSSRSCAEAAGPAELCPPCWSSLGHVMATLVLGQVVAAGKAKMACGASEAFLSCVSAPVAGEFIRAGEPPFTALPLTPERLLTCRKGGGNFKEETVTREMATSLNEQSGIVSAVVQQTTP